MPDHLPSQSEEIAQLKHQLATAEARLERAQSFVFDLRCAAARRNRRGIRMREKDQSGLRSGIWSETDGLGDWVSIKQEDVPKPAASLLNPLARDLYPELGGAVPSSSASSSSLPSRCTFPNHFPPELFYHIAEHASRSTKAKLCLVSSSMRTIASPSLYRSMIVTSPAHFKPFLSDSLDPCASVNQSLTLDNVRSLDLTVKSGRLLNDYRDSSYEPVWLPRLSDLHLHLDEHDVDEDEPEPLPYTTTQVPYLELVSRFLSFLNPHSLSLSLEHRHWALWDTLDFPYQQWLQATGPWNRLHKIQFVDCYWIILFEPSSMFGQPDHYWTFKQEDLAHPVSFSWTFTNRIDGYDGASEQQLDMQLGNSLKSIIHEHRLYPYSGDNPILHLYVPKGDLGRLKQDLEGLPTQQKAMVRYSAYN